MKLFYISFIFLFIFSCINSSTDNNEENECRPIAEDVLEPHAAGNFWERVQLAYSDGDIETGLTDTGRIVIEKLLPVEIGGISYKVGVSRVIYSGNISGEDANLSWNGPTGLYSLGMIAFDDTLIVEPYLRCKYPVEVGEHWPVYITSYDPYESNFFVKDTLTYTCVKKNEPFITPIDTFNTIVYHYFYKPADDVISYWHTFQYYSPGIGPVGTEVYSSFYTTYSYENRKLRELKFRLQMIDYCLH